MSTPWEVEDRKINHPPFLAFLPPWLYYSYTTVILLYAIHTTIARSWSPLNFTHEGLARETYRRFVLHFTLFLSLIFFFSLKNYWNFDKECLNRRFNWVFWLLAWKEDNPHLKSERLFFFFILWFSYNPSANCRSW